MKMDERDEVDVVVLVSGMGLEKYEKKCIGSLVNVDSGCKLNIIVVDNGTTEEVKGAIRAGASMKLIENRKNLGIPIAWNQGGRAGKAPFIAFVNNDIIVTKNWAKDLLNILKLKDVGIVGPTLSWAGEKSHPQHDEKYAGKRHEMKYDDMEAASDELKKRYGEKVEFVSSYIHGSFFITKREVFEKLGGFDEKFSPAFYEEFDFNKRVRAAGLLTMWVKKVYIHHFGRSTFHEMKRRGVDIPKIRGESFRYFCEKYPEYKVYLGDNHE